MISKYLFIWVCSYLSIYLCQYIHIYLSIYLVCAFYFDYIFKFIIISLFITLYHPLLSLSLSLSLSIYIYIYISYTQHKETTILLFILIYILSLLPWKSRNGCERETDWERERQRERERDKERERETTAIIVTAFGIDILILTSCFFDASQAGGRLPLYLACLLTSFSPNVTESLNPLSLYYILDTHTFSFRLPVHWIYFLCAYSHRCNILFGNP